MEEHFSRLGYPLKPLCKAVDGVCDCEGCDKPSLPGLKPGEPVQSSGWIGGQHWETSRGGYREFCRAHVRAIKAAEERDKSAGVDAALREPSPGAPWHPGRT